MIFVYDHEREREHQVNQRRGTEDDAAYWAELNRPERPGSLIYFFADLTTEDF